MATFMGSEQIIFNAATATGTGTILSAIDWQHVILTIASVPTHEFTIKFQGSNSDSFPNFASAQSVTNRREYIQVKDLQNGASIDGDTGISFGVADNLRMVEMNTNRLKWVCATITSYVSGTITVSALGSSNQ